MAKKRRDIFAKSDFSPVFRHFVNLLVNRIVVNNLPEEINEKFLLYHVLLFGRVLFFKKSGKYHVMWFSGKGKLDEYYIQNEFLVVNPWADNTSGDYSESNACILYSDINAYLENTDVGLYDFVKDYSDIINSIDCSIRALAKNTKIIGFVTGASTSIVNSARQMINNLLNSDNCIGVCEESLVDAIRVNPITDRMDYKFSELIKTRQYFISDFYQKLGIANNQNMKAERLTDNESQLIENVSDIDFNHILDNLNYSVKFINEKFGLDISFELNEERDEVVNNSENEETGTDGNEGNDTEGIETSDSESGISGEQNVSGMSVERNSSEENLTMAIRAIVAEMIRGDNNGREGEPSDVRRDVQSEVQGLPVSAEDNGNDDESEVVNNSRTEEESSQTQEENNDGLSVEINVNINGDAEEVKIDDTETSDI